MPCVGWRRSPIRYPVRDVVSAYWATTNAIFFTSFYATAALVVPLFILAALVDQRDTVRDVARTRTQLLTLLATIGYMIGGEIGALYATAECDPTKVCLLKGGLAPQGYQLWSSAGSPAA